MATSMPRETENVVLGRTGISVPPLGIGTWQWGDRIWWQYGDRYTDADLSLAYRAGVDHGIRLFDTAEIYGMGTSERLLGQFSERDPSIITATKFFPFPWRFRAGDVERALRGSLRRLGTDHVDLYQIHWPIPLVPIEKWMDGLAQVVQNGLTRAVGVSNYNRGQVARAVRALEAQQIPLASNQIAYSLLNRAPEHNGVLQTCQALGVSVIAYSPLGMGMLSGKYTAENPPPGIRGRRYPPSRLKSMEPLIQSIRSIGLARDKTPSQIALNWVICKGAIPIPGAKNALQAEENAGALGWRLSSNEIATLDDASARIA
ncbi:MAG: aldo/keto reductase [Chloroflexota bacterium]